MRLRATLLSPTGALVGRYGLLRNARRHAIVWSRLHAGTWWAVDLRKMRASGYTSGRKTSDAAYSETRATV